MNDMKPLTNEEIAVFAAILSANGEPQDGIRLMRLIDTIRTERDVATAQVQALTNAGVVLEERLAAQTQREDAANEGHRIAWKNAGEAIEMLAAAGMGKPGKPNTLWAMVHEIIAERDQFKTALTAISAIRDSIVGRQGFNWSDHAYPLVAALDAAGFLGAGYEIARKNEGTMIEDYTRLKAEVVRLEALLKADWEDRPLPEDEAIKAAHPGRTNKHEIYAEAMRLVGARHSKVGLVELVNWLLARVAGAKAALAVPEGPGNREAWGRIVRRVWMAWASEQPKPKESWFLEWDQMSEPEREVDRRIGARLHNLGFVEGYNQRAVEGAELDAFRAKETKS